MQARFVFGGATLIAALGFLIVSSLQAGTLQSVPVAQLRAKDASADSFVGKRLRVVGFVGKTPVRKTPQTTAQGLVNVAHFEVVEGATRCQVAYSDALPDSFRVGGPVQIDGTYIAPGEIRADHVLTKCPSKYQAGEGKTQGKAARNS